ncbi:MAG: asparagine synthase (glutamine-hydrolyzing) [Vampirovibrionales bacterium]|nr:asparagine synthase (glutamine-hydrolyzing) [Vampirovibrionales bacterium]
MCGVFGIFAKAGQPLSAPITEIVQAVDLLYHRGPDAQRLSRIDASGIAPTIPLCAWESFFGQTGTPIGYLGHTRLKIIDQSDSANQPFEYTAPNGRRYLIAYNGEIYNYRELVFRLKQRGYEFRTNCDTEVIPALYDLMGPDAIKEFNGMFAFALWDVTENKLLLARDRYGIKPLYLSELASGEIAFASETKSLLALSSVWRELDNQALYEHFTFQYALENKTLLKHVQHFPAGHWMLWDAQSGDRKTVSYWHPDFSINSKLSEQDFITELNALLKASVSRQLLGDVPIGSFLSGGLDTGAITALASKEIPNLYTLTCGFDIEGISGMERYFDERQAARELSELFKTSHHELSITSDTLPAIFQNVVWHLDDFQAGISYQNFVISALVKKHVTVVLSGVGGDELFAGYPWRYQDALTTSADDSTFAKQHYQQCVRLLNDPQKQALFQPDILKHLLSPSTESVFLSQFEKTEAETALQKVLGFDMQHFLKALLTVEDRLSMAHSVESRVPFLDNALVDLCLQMPDSLKLRLSHNNETVSKWGLRQALKKKQGLKHLLPDSVINARKQGFTPPDASWYRGKLRPWIESILLSEEALSRNVFQADALKKLLTDHYEEKANHRFLIWSLLCFESWQRQFIDTPSPQKKDILPLGD